ncbi:hypothetical protein Q3G72_020850 [Acer saccharum]|nr:hypothetical protein Q3G72_020850 [Acer saccharum]
MEQSTSKDDRSSSGDANLARSTPPEEDLTSVCGVGFPENDVGLLGSSSGGVGLRKIKWDKITAVMEFLVNKMHLEPLAIAKHS